MTDTPQNTPRDNATGPASTGATVSGDLSGISEMFGLRDGQQADTGTRTGTDTVGRWVAATEGADQPPDVSSRLVHGRYRLIAELGVGGMGVTYRAWDTKAGIPVVVKMPRREVRSDSEAMQRFAREIDAMLAVPHERIVPITDHGDDDGCPFVVMRFLPGGSLADYRRRDEAGNAIRNPPGMLHFWLPVVAAALDHIHAKGMLHRDVKPGNIFLDGFLKPYLGDFGIAKVVDESGGLVKEQTLTATKMAVGTPEYMAPELFKPRSKPNGSVDQYALAVTVYEMLSGEKPFKGDRAHIIVEHSAMPVPSLAGKVPGLPQSLCIAVEKGLAKSAADRFPTCREFAAAVVAELAVLAPEADTVRLLCPSCKNILKLPQKAAGRSGKCPRCQAAMDVAADLGSLWLESEERGGGGFDKQVTFSEPEPRSEPTPKPRPRRWGVREWVAMTFAVCCGLAVGYPWGGSVATSLAQREIGTRRAAWQRKELDIETEKKALLAKNRQLEGDLEKSVDTETKQTAENGRLTQELAASVRSRDVAMAENRRLVELSRDVGRNDGPLPATTPPRSEAKFKTIEDEVRKRETELRADGKPQQAAVVLVLEPQTPAISSATAHYRLYSAPNKGGGYSGDNTVPLGVSWSRLESVRDDQRNRTLVIDQVPGHHELVMSFPLKAGEVRNLGRIVLPKIQAGEGTTLKGGVRTEEGGVAAGALVKLPGVDEVIRTDAVGSYRVSNLGLGERSVLVSLDGYATAADYRFAVTEKRAEMVRDFVLFRPRTVRFSYALSPEGSTQLAGPGVVTGTKQCVLNAQVNQVVTRGKANDEFDRFAEDLGLRFWFENGTVSRCDLFMGGNPVGKPPADLRFDEIKEFASSLLGSTQRASDLATGSIVVMQNKYQPKGRACKILIDAIEPPLSSRQIPTGSAQAKPPVTDMETLTNSIGMKLRLIPAGSFTMGDDSGDADERPAHRVTITKPFYLGTHEVTNAQYRRVMGDLQSAWKADDHPVETVSWEDAVTFCRELSNLPEEKRTGRVYRLPTEAEWEYACRAGTATRYSCGDTERDLDAFAWFPWGANRDTHAVGQKKPNDWGLFDMHGNVWEWTGDWYGAAH